MKDPFEQGLQKPNLETSGRRRMKEKIQTLMAMLKCGVSRYKKRKEKEDD